MHTRHLGPSVLITIMFLACFGMTMISPAHGATIPITLNIQYNGGTTQTVSVDAAATSGYTTSTWDLHYANSTLITSGNLLDQSTNHYTATIPVMKYDDGDYYVYVYISDGGTDSGSASSPFTIKQVYFFKQSINAFYDPGTDLLTINSVLFYTSQDLDKNGVQDDYVPQGFITSAKWVLYDIGGGAVMEGDLVFTVGTWKAPNQEIKWRNGNFTVGAKFLLTNGTTLAMSPALQYTFSRNNASELYIIVIGIIVIAAVVIFTTIGIYNKRHANRDLGKKKEKKEKKEIKVVQISNEEIKKAKAGKKAPPPKEEPKEEPKGVTKKSGDLIFEVPKWEEGDGNTENK